MQSPDLKYPMLGLMLIAPLGCATQNTNAAAAPAATMTKTKPAKQDAASEVVAFYPDAAMKARKKKLGDGNAANNGATKSAIKAGDKALTLAPLSVMEKRVDPPSGDKHDYMSVGPYWWPDPAKADGLPWIRKDGQVNPATRSTDVTDYPSLLKVAKAVEDLAEAYYYSGDEKYAAHATKLLKVWFLDPATAMNPNLNYGQAVPGANDGRSFGIIETVNWNNMLQYVPLLDGSKSWTPNDKKALQNWFVKYTDWLQTSKIGTEEGKTTNNHSSWYDVQVTRYALFADRPEVARDVLQKAAQRRIATQIEPDGSQPHELKRTKSWSYSTMNLSALFELAQLAETQGIDLWNYKTDDGRSLKAALDYLAPYADPQKEWPHPQLEKPGQTLDTSKLVKLLNEGYRVYGDERYETLAQMAKQNG